MTRKKFDIIRNFTRPFRKYDTDSHTVLARLEGALVFLELLGRIHPWLFDTRSDTYSIRLGVLAPVTLLGPAIWLGIEEITVLHRLPSGHLDVESIEARVYL